MQLHTEITQGSIEWQTLRLGKITGSGFAKLMGTSEARKKYLYDRASEIVTGQLSDGDNFTNVHIRRGQEFENLAKMKYTILTFNTVKDIGFVQQGQYIGCSPDGLVDDDGMIEIKVPDSNNYFRQVIEINSLKEEAISKDHYLQMQFNLYVCQREWCDYVLYNPAHEKHDKAILIQRISKNQLKQQEIHASLTESVEELRRLVELYHTLDFNF